MQAAVRTEYGGPVHLADHVGGRRLGLEFERPLATLGVDAPGLQREVARQGEQLADIGWGGGERVGLRHADSLRRDGRIGPAGGEAAVARP